MGKKSSILFLISQVCFFAISNRVNCDVVVLNDSNFEHHTQVSSGHTTGDWFVKFYSPLCGHCNAMKEAWKGLGKQLKGQINIAEVDVSVNTILPKRFNILGLPTLLHFSHGKMYEYNSSDRSTKEMSAFATGGYSKEKAKDIPAELTQLDILLSALYEAFGHVKKILEHVPAAFFMILSLGLISGILITYIFAFIFSTLFKRNGDEPTSRKSKSKKKD